MVTAIAAVLIFVLPSCSTGPQPIKLGKDACSFCKMSIADNRFGAEIITPKGKIFKFDDIHCVLAFLKENTTHKKDMTETYFVNFNEPHNLIDVHKALLLKSKELHSPMRGNIAVYDEESKFMEGLQKFKGERVVWQELISEQ